MQLRTWISELPESQHFLVHTSCIASNKFYQKEILLLYFRVDQAFSNEKIELPKKIPTNNIVKYTEKRRIFIFENLAIVQSMYWKLNKIRVYELHRNRYVSKHVYTKHIPKNVSIFSGLIFQVKLKKNAQ